jgi:hypothetical protein
MLACSTRSFEGTQSGFRITDTPQPWADMQITHKTLDSIIHTTTEVLEKTN